MADRVVDHIGGRAAEPADHRTVAPPPAGRPPMATVPVGLRVKARRILVVGAGPVAARKAEAYVRRGADVVVVAPTHCPAMDELPVTERHHRSFREGDLHDVWLVVTATGNPEVDGLVFAAAEARRVWCNAADDPDHCSVILPAVSEAGPLTVAVSTGGTSPAVASWLRRRIDQLLDHRTVAAAHVAAAVRTEMKDRGMATEVPGWAAVLDRYGTGGRTVEPEELRAELRQVLIGPTAASGQRRSVSGPSVIDRDRNSR